MTVTVSQKTPSQAGDATTIDDAIGISAIATGWTGSMQETGDETFTESTSGFGSWLADKSRPLESTELREPTPPSLRRKKKTTKLQAVATTHDAEALRMECDALARRSRDLFKDACKASHESDVDLADANYLGAIQQLEDLWEFGHLRGQEFNDLLGLLSAATKHSELDEFNSEQRVEMMLAFEDLCTWLIDENSVERHIEEFARLDINILSPVLSPTGKRYRIQIEEIDETKD
jgi:hypothetical protein